MTGAPADAETGSRADASSPQAVSTEGFDPARTQERISELHKMLSHGSRASDVWMIRSEIAWLNDRLGGGR